jgi:hypothetical protein
MAHYEELLAERDNFAKLHAIGQENQREWMKRCQELEEQLEADRAGRYLLRVIDADTGEPVDGIEIESAPWGHNTTLYFTADYPRVVRVEVVALDSSPASVPKEPCLDCTHDYCRCVERARAAQSPASEPSAEDRQWTEATLRATAERWAEEEPDQHSDPVDCDGSADCKSEQHILGCFAGPKEQSQHSELVDALRQIEDICKRDGYPTSILTIAQQALAGSESRAASEETPTPRQIQHSGPYLAAEGDTWVTMAHYEELLAERDNFAKLHATGQREPARVDEAVCVLADAVSGGTTPGAIFTCDECGASATHYGDGHYCAECARTLAEADAEMADEARAQAREP